MPDSLVSCEWLKEQLDKRISGIRIIDGTWNQAAWKRDTQQEYLDGHIPGAVRFDIFTVSDKGSTLPLMLPQADQFAKQVGEMGVSNDTHVVIYDNNAKFGFYSAGRVWWMFKIFGHDKVSIVDGGLPKWKASGYPMAMGPQEQVPTLKYMANFNPVLLRTLDQVKEAIDAKTAQVCDGRSTGRYNGTAPEPNPKLRSGHILGSYSVPFTSVIDPDTKTLKSQEGIKQAFEAAGVDLGQPLLVSCGGAVVAGMLAFSLSLLDIHVPVYDGSWTDWVQNAPDNAKHLGVKGEDL